MNNLVFGLILWIVLGAVLGTTMLLNHRRLKKNGIVDERFQRIHHYGRSYAWVASTMVIWLVWFISLFVVESKPAFFLITAIFFGHMLSYIIGAAVAQSRN